MLRARWRVKVLTFRHDECGKGGGSKGGADGVALLGGVDPAVPAAPGLSGGEHAASTAHLHSGVKGISHTQNREGTQDLSQGPICSTAQI